MKINLLYLTLIVIYFSCSNPKSKSVDITAVNLDLRNTKKTSSIEFENNLGSYGPIDEDANNPISVSNTKTLTVLLMPGMYRTLLSLDVLKCFEMNSININVVSGVEFSSLIASLFVQGHSPEEIKWLLFNKAREIEDVGYSSEWIKEWKNFLENKVEENIIKSSQMSLWLYKRQAHKKGFLVARNIKDEINYNIDVNSKDYILESNFVGKEFFKDFPTDKLIVLNSMPKVLKFSKPSEFLVGHFGRLYSYVYKNKYEDKNILWIDIESKAKLDDPSSRVELDSLEQYCTQIFKFYNG